MEPIIFSITLITFPALAMFSSITSDPEIGGEANGSLTVNEQTVDIRHAYVRAEPGESGLDYHIILTDVPLDVAVLNDDGEMWKRSREGNLHYLLFELHDSGEGMRRIDLRHPAFQPLGYVNVAGTSYLFDIHEITEERVEIHAYMNDPVTSFDDTWLYDVYFAAPVKIGDSW